MGAATIAKAAAFGLSLADCASERVVVERLEVADSFRTRLLGLQFRKALPEGAGLLIVPCSSVHTFCLRFAIDLVGLDRSGEVIVVKRRVRPWRIALLPLRAIAVLELPAGASEQIRIGDRLGLRGEFRPPSLRFLPTIAGNDVKPPS